MTFKELLKECDMHGAQLARRIGVTRAAVGKWMSGDASPNYTKLPEISKALGVSIEKIVQCFIDNKKAEE